MEPISAAARPPRRPLRWIDGSATWAATARRKKREGSGQGSGPGAHAQRELRARSGHAPAYVNRSDSGRFGPFRSGRTFTERYTHETWPQPEALPRAWGRLTSEPCMIRWALAAARFVAPLSIS